MHLLDICPKQFVAIAHAGVCGDPFKPKDAHNGVTTVDSDFFGKPCEPIITYEEGQVIDITIHVQAQHGGMWEMRLCDQPGSSFPSQDCFNQHVLQRCAHVWRYPSSTNNCVSATIVLDP